MKKILLFIFLVLSVPLVLFVLGVDIFVLEKVNKVPEGCHTRGDITFVHFGKDCREEDADGYFKFNARDVVACSAAEKHVDVSSERDHPLKLSMQITRGDAVKNFEVIFNYVIPFFSFNCRPGSSREAALHRLFTRTAKKISKDRKDGLFVMQDGIREDLVVDLIVKPSENHARFEYYYWCNIANNRCNSSHIPILDGKYEIFMGVDYEEDYALLISMTDEIIARIEASFNQYEKRR